MMKKIMTRAAVAALLLAASVTMACSQSNPGLVYGQVPTAAQWNSYFAAKADWPVPTFTTTVSGSVPAPGTVGGLFLRDDGTWASAGGGGGGTPGGANFTIQYNNTGSFGGIGPGTATTVLHGNASGAGTFSAVSLTADVSGVLPIANGGTSCTAATISCITNLGSVGGTASSSTFLRGDGTWAAPAGSGNVTGPVSSIGDDLASFSGTSGTIIKDTGITQSSVVTLSGSQTLTNKTLTAPNLGTPTTLNLTNAVHLTPSTGLNATGTPSSSTYLRGDNTWQTIPGGGGNVVGSGTTVSGNIAVFNNTSATGIQDGSIAASALVTLTGSQTLTNKTLTSPNLGTPSAVNLANGTNLTPSSGLNASGSPSGSTFLRGDNTWATVTGTGTVTTLTAGAGISFTSGSTCTTTCTINLTTGLRANTSTTDTILSSDAGKVYTSSNASAQSITLPTVVTSGFGSGFGINAEAIGAGAAAISSASLIDGLGSISLTKGQGASIYSDTPNSTYHVIMGMPQVAADNVLLNGTASANYPAAAAIPTCSTAITFGSHAFACSGGSVGVFVLRPFTVAGLPAAATAGAGAIAYISDNNAACSYGGTPTGGGSTKCPVFSDGSAWTIH